MLSNVWQYLLPIVQRRSIGMYYCIYGELNGESDHRGNLGCSVGLFMCTQCTVQWKCSREYVRYHGKYPAFALATTCGLPLSQTTVVSGV